MTTKAEDVIHEGKKAASGVSKEVENFLADIDSLLKNKTAMGSAELGNLKDQIVDRFLAAKDSITATGSQVASRAKDAAATTNQYVHEEPWKAIGVGVAFGFLLGALVSRR